MMSNRPRNTMPYLAVLPMDCIQECPGLADTATPKLAKGRKTDAQVPKHKELHLPRSLDQRQRLRQHKALQMQQIIKQSMHRAHPRRKSSPAGTPRDSSSCGSASSRRSCPQHPVSPGSADLQHSLAGSDSGSSSASSSSSCDLDTPLRRPSNSSATSSQALRHSAAAAAAFVTAAAVAAAGYHHPSQQTAAAAAAVAANLKQAASLAQQATEGSRRSAAVLAAIAAATAAAGAADGSHPAKSWTTGSFFTAPVSPRWPESTSADGSCIPAAHTSSPLAPSDTGSSVFGSATSALATPRDLEAAVTAAAAAAEAAAERLKAVVPAAVPASLLQAAEQRVMRLVALDAVRSLRSHSTPESVDDKGCGSARCASDATPLPRPPTAAAARYAPPSAAGLPPLCRRAQPAEQLGGAPDSCRSSIAGSSTSRHYRSGPALRPPLHLAPWQVNPPRGPASSSAPGNRIHPQQQQDRVAPEQRSAQQQQHSSGVSRPAASGVPSSSRAAAPEMTAKAAAMFSTVAASVQDDLTMRQDTQRFTVPQRLSRSPASPRYVSLRTDRWVDSVARFMVDSGILPAHRIFIYMVRPVRPAPTGWQRAQKSLAKPLRWVERHLSKKSRARARALRRVAGY